MLLAVILLITGILVIILEFFIPSFGLIGLIGGSAVVGSIILAFGVSGTVGAIFLIAALITVPALLLVFFRIFPKTFIGKKLILSHSFQNDSGYTSSNVEFASLSGKTGTALTDLRPSGTILVDERRYSAVSSGEYILKDREIIIVKTEGSRILVSEVKK